jgi:hypothetical protein
MTTRHAQPPNEVEVEAAPTPATQNHGERVLLVLEEIANGTSDRKACRMHSVDRSQFLRDVAKAGELREQYAFAREARASALVDNMEAIAAGTDDDAHAFASVLAAELAGLDPKTAKAVASALIREQTARAKLRVHVAQWTASRLFPATWSATTTTQTVGQVTHTVRVVHDPLPRHLALGAPSVAEAEFTILEPSTTHDDTDDSGADPLDE